MHWVWHQLEAAWGKGKPAQPLYLLRLATVVSLVGAVVITSACSGDDRGGVRRGPNCIDETVSPFNQSEQGFEEADATRKELVGILGEPLLLELQLCTRSGRAVGLEGTLTFETATSALQLVSVPKTGDTWSIVSLTAALDLMSTLGPDGPAFQIPMEVEVDLRGSLGEVFVRAVGWVDESHLSSLALRYRTDAFVSLDFWVRPTSGNVRGLAFRGSSDPAGLRSAIPDRCFSTALEFEAYEPDLLAFCAVSVEVIQQ